jgi:ferredoxin-NADP reductase
VSALLAPHAVRWRVATVAELIQETAQAVTIMLDLPDWPGHVAGQHVDIRLTAPDGYQAQRSYSIASAPEDDHLVLTVERIEDGEVSSYLVGELRQGDELELRGPIGGYFVWDEPLGGPVMLIAGGSGIAPLQAIVRHRLAAGGSTPVRLLYSARSQAELIFYDELVQAGRDDAVDVRFTLTREQPDGWDGYDRRVDRAMLEEFVWPPAERPLVYVCGPTAFVEVVADGLVALGHAPSRIRTERFGPTG